MVFLLTSIVLCIVLALFHPYSSRLGATGLWLGKALISPDLAGLSPRGLQDALTDGTISRINFVVAILPLPIAAVSFFYTWWSPILVFAFYIVAIVITNRTRIASKQLDYYLNVILAEMGKRRIKYQLAGDTERTEIMTELEQQVTEVLEIYFNSDVLSPNMREAKEAPFGDIYYLLK